MIVRRTTIALAVLPLLLAGCDWAQAGFNGSNVGSQTFNHAFDPGTIGSLRASWTVSLPEPTPAQLVVSGGTVFASAPLYKFLAVVNPLPQPSDVTGSPSTTTTPPTDPSTAPPFEALDAADGSLRWDAGSMVTTPSVDHGSCTTWTDAGVPLVQAGTVYGFSTWTSCDDAPGVTTSGSMSTRDAATGAVVTTESGYVEVGHPVGDSRAIYETRRSTPGATSQPVFDVAGSDGFDFVAPAGQSLGAPAINAHMVFVVDGSRTLRAVDRETGVVRWSSRVGAAGAVVTPSVGDGKVFVSTPYHLLAFDETGGHGCSTADGATTCAPVWDNLVDSSAGSQDASKTPPTISDHRVFVREGQLLKSFSADTGDLLWQARTAPDVVGGTTIGVPVFAAASPSVAGSIVFIGTASAKLQAYDADGVHGCTVSDGVTTCTPLWSADLPGDATASRPVISGDDVYISSTAPSGSGTPTGALSKFTLGG